MSRDTVGEAGPVLRT